MSGDVLPDQHAALSWRSLVSAASWMSGAHIVAQAFAYGSLIVLASILPPGSVGTIASGTAIVWMAAMLMEAGTHGSIVVTPRLTHSLVRRAFWRCLLGGIGLATAMAIGAEMLARTVVKGADAAALAVLGISLPLYAFAIVPLAILHRAMEFGKLARVTAAGNIGSAGVALVAGLAGAGVWALVMRQLLWFGLLAAFATVVARPHLAARSSAHPPVDDQPARSASHRWFFLFGFTLVLTQSLDYLVIGSLGNVQGVGLYALAFMIAFAPVHHFSNEVGKVLFAAAAASDLESSAGRTLHAVRVMALLLMPLVPAAIVLAPFVLPTLLGREWTSMVAPFQLLLVVAVGHAVVDCVGEALSGVGEIAFRAKLNVAWCLAMLVALIMLVPADGIRGAALAHLAVFMPYAAVYATAGARRTGISAGQLWQALRPVVQIVGIQAAVTGAVALSFKAAGSPDGIAATAGALAGLAVLAIILTGIARGPAREAATLLRAAVRGTL
jgi:O-antigen/teichoic acid export membrane protein